MGDSLQNLADEIRRDVMNALAPALESTISAMLRENSRVTFSESEAAEILGMAERTLADIRRAGKIDFCKSGGAAARYRRAHLDAYLDRHDTMPETAREAARTGRSQTLLRIVKGQKQTG